MTIILILAAIVVCAGLAWFFLRKPSDASSTVLKDGKIKGGEMTPEQAELFAHGIDPGTDSITVMYALETCRHCRKTREFLDENHVAYHILYVDSFTGDARSRLMDKVREYNPRGSFPTIVLPDGKSVVGFREQLLREALLHDTGSTT